EDFNSGTDEDNARVAAGTSKVRVFRQEAIARMDGVNLVFTRKRDNPVDVEISANGLADFAHGIRLVRLKSMERKAVFVRVDCDRANAKLVGRAKDTYSNFAAIGDQEPQDWSRSRAFFCRHDRSNSRHGIESAFIQSMSRQSELRCIGQRRR